MNVRINIFLFVCLFSSFLFAEEKFFHDPMRPLITMPTVIPKMKNLKINMIFHVVNPLKKNIKSWAIINGTQYFIGDFVEGRKLVNIDSGEVVFEYEGKLHKKLLTNKSYISQPRDYNKRYVNNNDYSNTQ